MMKIDLTEERIRKIGETLAFLAAKSKKHFEETKSLTPQELPREPDTAAITALEIRGLLTDLGIPYQYMYDEANQWVVAVKVCGEMFFPPKQGGRGA